jgi:hypothetical protein
MLIQNSGDGWVFPVRELIVWEYDELRASLARGVGQVRAGETAELDLASLDVPDETAD